MNACCIDYIGTWSSKRIHSLPNSNNPHCGTTDYRCEDRLEFNTAVAWGSLPIMRIDPWVAPKSKILWLPIALHNTGWMDHRKALDGRFEVIPILDRVDIEEAYGRIALCHHFQQWHAQSHGQHYRTFGWEEDSTEGRLVLHREVSKTEAVKILYYSNSHDGYALLFCTYLWSFSEVAIVSDVVQWNEYES